MAESSSLLGELEACDLHDGEWGTVGSIISWNYMHDGKAKVAKDRIEVVEPEKKLIKFKVLEGDLMEEFKSFLITIQVTPKQGGNGSIVKRHFEYKKIDEIDEHLLFE
uniref:Bet v I/Major latex protein domain-containing protein n=1 Tax=Brassica oleracea var. oleracea TaxID=109376 RepID=A0A0D2ZUI9_BRAOL